MESTVQVAVIGIFTTVITTLGIVATAVINNRKERGNAATSAMEQTLRERITLRDEQIKDLQQDLAQLQERNRELSEENKALKEAP